MLIACLPLSVVDREFESRSAQAKVACLPLSVVDREFESRSAQAKDY
jgi:hypothetical protein